MRKRIIGMPDFDTEGLGDFYYYDGDRVVEHYAWKTDPTAPVVTDPLDNCSPPDPPPPPPPGPVIEEKRIAGADTPTKSDVGWAPPTSEPTSSVKPASYKEPGDVGSAVRTTDGVYSTIKQQTLAAAGPDKSGLRTMAIPEPIAIQGAPVLQKSFVYGMNYIDEVVAQIMPTPTATASVPALRWVLQDANYNVVGLARECDNSLIRQFRYQPYGDFERDGAGHVTGIEEVYETGTPVAVVQADGTPITIPTPADLQSPQGFEGLWYDAETGFYHMRARYTDSKTGRPVQRDMNGMGLVLSNSLTMNGQGFGLSAYLSASAQYGDGLSLYQLFRSNPNSFRDPAGLAVLLLEQQGAVGIGATLMGGLIGGVSAGKAFALNMIGRMMASQYLTALAVFGAEAQMSGLDIAAVSVLESEIVNWFAGMDGADFTNASEGFQDGVSSSTGGNGQDPNEWRRLFERLPDFKRLRFSDGALRGMEQRNIHRSVIEDVLANGTRLPDPQGVSNQWMYYREMVINGRLRMMEVLWNAEFNEVRHALYKTIK